MSNTILNLRVLYWHFQILRDPPWVSLGFNSYHWEHGIGFRWIELY